MTIRENIEKHIAVGFTFAQARSFVAQQIILSKIEKSRYVDKVLLKGGVVMYNMTHERRRTTLDLDFDFVRYDIRDNERILRFIDHLNAVIPQYEIRIAGEIKQLHQQDYKGKRVKLIISDETESIPYKLDIGVHTLLAVKQNKMCFSFNENNRCELYVNPPEQIFAEKAFSFAKIGPASVRHRDIDDMYYLITNCSLDISVVRGCLSMITMNEPYGIKDTYDVVEKVVDSLNDPLFRNNYVRNNGSWLGIDYSISKEAITAFLYKL